MDIEEAKAKATAFLKAYLKSRHYFHAELSRLEQGVTLAPLIFGDAQTSGPDEIKLIFVLDRALDWEDPDPPVRAAVEESVSALRTQHPELSGFKFVERIT